MISIQRGGFQTSSSLVASDIFDLQFPILHVKIAVVAIVHARCFCILLAGTTATLPAFNAVVTRQEVEVLLSILPPISHVNVESLGRSKAR